MLPEKNVYWKDIPEHATVKLVGSVYVARWKLKVYHRHAVVYWMGNEVQQAQLTLNNLVKQKTIEEEPEPEESRVFRLREDDFLLLRDIAKGRDMPRHAALCKLVDVLKGLEIERAPKKKERSPLRVGIPNKLHAAINKKVNETGRTYTDILLIAARTWRESSK